MRKPRRHCIVQSRTKQKLQVVITYYVCILNILIIYSRQTPVTKVAKYFTANDRSFENRPTAAAAAYDFNGIERDLNKYADKRVMDLYKQTVQTNSKVSLSIKDVGKASTTNNTQCTPRKTLADTDREYDLEFNSRQTDNFNALRQFLTNGEKESKERKSASSIYQKLQARSQKPSASKNTNETSIGLDDSQPATITFKSSYGSYGKPSHNKALLVPRVEFLLFLKELIYE